MIKSAYLAVGCLFFVQLISAQEKDSLALQFHLKFGHELIVPGKKYVSKHDTLQVDALRFYVSHIEIRYADQSVSKLGKSHLVDLEIPESQKINLMPYSKKPIKAVIFALGIDSLASVSGALSGDLDPAKGMYWAWQSGYINMKIEGKSTSCKTRKNQFQFHIGGYLKPNNALRRVAIPIAKIPHSSIDVNLDLAQLMDKLELKTQNSVMIPGKEAMVIADLSTKMFSIE